LICIQTQDINRNPIPKMKSNSDFSIFLVDDDPFFLCLLEKILQNAGFPKITSFDSGTALLNSLKGKPDIILMDYNMESMNGLETLKKVKRVNENALVVFVSGQEKIEIAVNALTYGAFGYMMKSQMTELSIKNLMDKAVMRKEMIMGSYKERIYHSLLSTISFPVLVYLILETFFK
jgi:DNA-binding NarL/FixJ family response regulator